MAHQSASTSSPRQDKCYKTPRVCQSTCRKPCCRSARLEAAAAVAVDSGDGCAACADEGPRQKATEHAELERGTSAASSQVQAGQAGQAVQSAWAVGVSSLSAPPPRFRVCMRVRPFSFFFESVLKLKEDQHLRSSQINRPDRVAGRAGLARLAGGVWRYRTSAAICFCTEVRLPAATRAPWDRFMQLTRN